MPTLAYRLAAVSTTVLLSLTGVASTSLADTHYQRPPKPIADLIDAAPTPTVSIGPSNEWLAILALPSLPPISELAEPELRLAGVRINPATNGRSRSSYYTGMTLQRIADGTQRKLAGIPSGPRLGSIRWSPDGAHIAFTVTTTSGIELWCLDIADPRARRLGDLLINGCYGAGFTWLPDSSGLICRVVPRNRPPAPSATTIPEGPVVQETTGRQAPARTYQDLLKNEHDAALFEHYMLSQVVSINLEGVTTSVGKTGLITRAAPAPNGEHILVETVERPFSYVVPSSRFPKRIEVWNAGGQVDFTVARVPLADDIPIGFGAARTGRRSVGWRADAPATLYWVEAADGGNPRIVADIRDRVYLLSAPFGSEPVELISLPLRYGGVTWGHDHLALVGSWWWSSRREQSWIVDPVNPGAPPRLLHDRSFEDRYTDPGSPMTRINDHGHSVLITRNDGKHLFYTGSGASPEGNRPFLDRLDLETLETTRLWRSQAPHYETVETLIDVRTPTLITRRESKQVPPNYYIRAVESGKLTALTEFPHPMPQMVDIYKEMIHYQRSDGIKLNGTLYLPPGKTPADGPFPMLMWAYPQEFKSADAAGQVTDSPHRFVRVSKHSPLHWLMMGYAVLDDPSLPIVGEGDSEPNDTFVPQLVAGADAAVNEVLARGVADPQRIAIGGHSYGAFMTANLLAHCDLFCAGIARSGAYNRTLTPFSFQSEERTFWEAPEIYMGMSPFTHADKINEPLLLIHGDADNNSGTYPMQSERFYAALKGHGATARLVMLPLESHGYRSRESVGHMAWEMTMWLERYVKNRPSGEPLFENEPSTGATQ